MSAAKRRQYGTGSLCQECSPKRGCPDRVPGEDGKLVRPKHACKGRWVGFVEAGTSERGTRRRLKVVRETESKARQAVEALAKQIAKEGAPPPGRSRATVKSWSEQWLALHATRVRPSAYATDASSVKKWIVPNLGTLRIEDVTPDRVRYLTDTIIAAGRSTTTAGYAQGVLLRMLRAARLEGHRIQDRTLDTPAPGKAVTDRDGMSLEGALAVLKVALERPDASRWVAALLQGMRQGECLGLTWSCVDLEAGTIDVSWQLDDLPYLDRAAETFRVPDGYEAVRLYGAYHLVRPKSKSGHRVIPLVPWMSAALADWKKVAPANQWGLVWPAERRTRGGQVATLPQVSKTDLAEWKAIQAEASVQHPAGRPYVLHEARNTTATLLLEGGVPEPVQIAIMGHSAIATTRRYQHVSQALAQQALDAVAERFELTMK